MVSFCLENRISALKYDGLDFLTFDRQVEVEVNNKNVLVLNNVLSDEECTKIINLHIEHTPVKTTDRLKICILIKELSDVIMKRCKSFIKQSIYIDNNIPQIGHSTDYKYWERPEINPEWRIVKCNTGSKMSRHLDGVYVKSVDYKSIYTVILYLTDNIDGSLEIDGMSILPKKGRICIFRQSLVHEGLINSSEKYFLRSELLYHRQKPCETDDDKEAMKLLEEAKRVYYEDINLSLTLEDMAYKLSSNLEDSVLNT
jgi:hypothetical protein